MRGTSLKRVREGCGTRLVSSSPVSANSHVCIYRWQRSMEGRLRAEDRGHQGKLWRAYKLYVLLVMMVLYLINQMDRFVLGIGSQSISQDLQFGEMSCHPNASLSNGSCQDECSKLHNQTT